MTDLGPGLAAHLAIVARLDAGGELAGRPAARAVSWLVADLAVLAAYPSPQVELSECGLVVSGSPVRVAAAVADALADLDRALGAHGAGGFAVRGAVDRDALLALFRGLRSVPANFDLDALQRWLELNGAAAVRLLPRGEAGDASVARAAPESLKVYGRLWYAVAKARAARSLAGAPLEVRRAMRLVVERAEAEPRVHLALSALADDEDVATRHCVHAAILAIALGQRLGLGRGDLVDLGLAALLAADLPEGADEAAAVNAAGAQLARPPLSAGLARRMLAVWEHKAPLDRGHGRLHLFARIVAVAVDYDALVARSGLRQGLLPDEALLRMQAQAGRRYDKALLKVFAEMLGPWPLGTAVLLDSGEVAIVYASTPGLGQRPTVRLVVDRRGQVLRDGPLMDLSAGGPRIVASVDAGLVGVDPADALLG
ncbi:MAG: HD domain-containing phosphohydrolase [Myxococcota bacterium]